MVRHLVRQIVGPAPAGKAIDPGAIHVDSESELFHPWHQADSGEEILTSDRPLTRYGVGVLHSTDRKAKDASADAAPSLSGSGNESGPAAGITEGSLGNDGNLTADESDNTDGTTSSPGSDAKPLPDETGQEDFELSLTNARDQASMGITFAVQPSPGALVTVTYTGGRYLKKQIQRGGNKPPVLWWLRQPVRAVWKGSLEPQTTRLELQAVEKPDEKVVDIRPAARVRRGSDGEGQRAHIITVAVTNRTPSNGRSLDETTLFQSQLSVTVTDASGTSLLVPFPEIELNHEASDDAVPTGIQEARDEDESLALLYRSRPVWAAGHGCAGDWTLGEESPARALSVEGRPLPEVELPEMTPDVQRADGSALSIDMRTLGLGNADVGLAALGELVDEYERWIRTQERSIADLKPRYQPAARRHTEELWRCAGRMRDGLGLLHRDETVARAFRLANEAVLLQQLHGLQKTTREILFTADGRIAVAEPAPGCEPDPHSEALRKRGVGFWRAFQIGFLLSSIASTAQGTHDDRDIVDLIWFPTGGGKTEAYLGLTAFTIFLRYLRNPDDRGVEVLMRYTLRLLTAQQFQRAARLVCAAEVIRRREWPERSGDRPFSIGIWVGGDSTPNTHKAAKDALKELDKNVKARNPFLLLACPWCQAQMGPVRVGAKGKGSKSVEVCGYRGTGAGVLFCCPDAACDFSQDLPVHIVDDAVYETRPELVIGTIDKFAMLAWRPDARALFGLGPDGQRQHSPPNLIIQDELHLISGPLGSVAGLYETLIEELCTDRRGATARIPKIVASTATIRRYRSQVQLLYARERTDLFPPPGLDTGDSFFARIAREADGSPKRGKRYLGVFAPGYGSFQTAQVRTFSALLQGAYTLPEDYQDPWWTLLVFYNSIRELGGGQTLFLSDVPEAIAGVQKRRGDPSRRFLNDVRELTSRTRAEDIPKSLDRLSAVKLPSRKAVDACLASNIIEVGVDIDRLSLMAIVGQPKTTAQYIQVSGRVGRRWQERPGLVVTLYSPAKPRDRSHYERFRAYHERLYAQVEPTGVTPFSLPSIVRSLPSLMVAWARQHGAKTLKPDELPLIQPSLERLYAILDQRIGQLDPDERPRFRTQWDQRMKEWRAGQATEWGPPFGNDFVKHEVLYDSLMYQAGRAVPEDVKERRWSVGTSMRSVDPDVLVSILPPKAAQTDAPQQP